MKTLVVYNKEGQLVFTQTNATEQYNCIVEEQKEYEGLRETENTLSNWCFYLV